MGRVYLDHNATAPLRSEARTAMLSALDNVGNPSSVHGEGRTAKSVIERARGQIADAFGAQDADIVFTSGATEAAALALASGEFQCAGIEHEAVLASCEQSLTCDAQGHVAVSPDAPRVALQRANSETGVLQDLPGGVGFSDMVQAAGKIPVDFGASGAVMAAISAHKLGGPKGVGALILRRGTDLPAMIRGGGQEMGRRSGTENVAGIAGFGAAAEAAARDVAEERWARVEKLRNILENTLEGFAKETIFVGHGALRLPNTSCILTPGWRGETQVMQMDLAGFAISAGSACSSGKVSASRVLRAMGYSQAQAGCAIRVSLGLETSEDEIMRFAESWGAQARRRAA